MLLRAWAAHTPVPTTATAAAASFFSTTSASAAASTAYPTYRKIEEYVARPPDFPTREAQIAALRDGGEFDVLIVGAGATGSGAALDAATRGLKTACLEKGDFSSETSSRSTKLIWAGIRYIGTAVAALLSRRLLTNPVDAWNGFVGEFKMVLGAHRERRFLLETQPHLTNWV